MESLLLYRLGLWVVDLLGILDPKVRFMESLISAAQSLPPDSTKK